MPTVESILNDVRQLSAEDWQRLMKALTLVDVRETMHRIASQPEKPLPIGEQELDEIVHEARDEMLRARGL